MSANTTPIYTLTSRCASVAVPATAETSRTAPTNVVKALTAGANGARVEGLWATATGTTTAGMIRLFHRIADAGDYLLVGEIAVSAVTPSGTVACWQGSWAPALSPFVLGATDCLYVATHNAEAFTATPIAGDF